MQAEEQKRKCGNRSTETKVRKRKYGKRKYGNESTETRVRKRKYGNESTETKVRKRKYGNESTETKVRKPKVKATISVQCLTDTRLCVLRPFKPKVHSIPAM